MAAQDEPYKPFSKVAPEELQSPPTENSQSDQAQNKKPPNKELSSTISIVGVVLISIVLFISGYFYLQSLQEQNVEDKQELEAEEKKKEEKGFEQIEENAKNDSIRKLDLATLNKGVEKYFSSKRMYPKKMEELTPDYIRVIPLDPVNKEPYAYKSNEEFSSYSLSAKLSDGSTYTLGSDSP